VAEDCTDGSMQPAPVGERVQSFDAKVRYCQRLDRRFFHDGAGERSILNI